MAGGQERKLRRRIKTVQSTKKITRAMELIAASRIVKAQQAILAARPYLEQMQNVVADVADTPDAKHHRLFHKETTEGSEQQPGVAVIAIAGDRGLSGGYNSSIVRAAEREISRRTKGSSRRSHLVAVGRKVEGYFVYRDRPIEASITGASDRPSFSDSQKIVKAVSTLFESGKVDEIVLVYTQFVNAATQRVVARQLVPMEPPTGGEHKAESERTTVDFEYEPDPSQILDRLLPRWLEAEVFTALLEAAASEHAARQAAMKAATDNADELITSLTRVMNRARQAAITTEIMEIVGGAEALRAASGDAQSFSEIYVPPTPSGAQPSLAAQPSTHRSNP